MRMALDTVTEMTNPNKAAVYVGDYLHCSKFNGQVALAETYGIVGKTYLVALPSARLVFETLEEAVEAYEAVELT